MSKEYSAPSQYAPTYIQLERAYKEMKEQRDELLEALQKLLPNLYYEEREIAEATIVKAQGQ